MKGLLVLGPALRAEQFTVAGWPGPPPGCPGGRHTGELPGEVPVGGGCAGDPRT